MVVLILGVTSAARAQSGGGTVRGTLLDVATSQPVPFANVVLLRAQDSSFVAGAQTTEAFTDLERILTLEPTAELQEHYQAAYTRWQAIRNQIVPLPTTPGHVIQHAF